MRQLQRQDMINEETRQDSSDRSVHTRNVEESADTAKDLKSRTIALENKISSKSQRVISEVRSQDQSKTGNNY